MTIQIMKIYKESFKNVWGHMLEWIRVAFAPFVVWALGFLFMAIVYWSEGRWSYDAFMNQMQGLQSPQEYTFLMGFSDFVYNIAYFIALASIYINGFRYAILEEGGDRWWTLHLNRRLVKTILYYLLIMVLGGIYVAISGGIVFGAHILFESIVLDVVLGALFAIYGIYLMYRIILTFPLIAIDQKKPIRVSWRLLKGNVLRLFGLIFLIIISLLLLGLAGVIVLGILGWVLALINPWLAGIAALLLLVFGLFIWLLSWGVVSKAMSVVYKDLT